METHTLPGVIELDTDEMIAINGGEPSFDPWYWLWVLLGMPTVGGPTSPPPDSGSC